MKTVALIFLSLLNVLGGSCQKKINLQFSIKLDFTNVSKENDLNIQLIFRNVGDTDLLVTRLLDYSYKKGLSPKSHGDLIWEIEKLCKNKYLEQSTTVSLSPMPFYVPKEEQFDTLVPQKAIIKIFPLYYFYQLGVGS